MDSTVRPTKDEAGRILVEATYLSQSWMCQPRVDGVVRCRVCLLVHRENALERPRERGSVAGQRLRAHNELEGRITYNVLHAVDVAERHATGRQRRAYARAFRFALEVGP